MFLKDGLYSENPTQAGSKVASFLVHGDAAFCGQGIVSLFGFLFNFIKTKITHFFQNAKIRLPKHFNYRNCQTIALVALCICLQIIS